MFLILFYSEKVPFVSTNVYSKLIFRALKRNDMKLLQKLIDDVDKVHSVGGTGIIPSVFDSCCSCVAVSLVLGLQVKKPCLPFAG